MAENGPTGVSLILAGGLTPQNVSRRDRKVRPWGVDVASGVERKAGVKDPILVRDFIKEARKLVNTFNLWAIMEMNQTPPTIGRRIQHGDDGTPRNGRFGNFGGMFVPDTNSCLSRIKKFLEKHGDQRTLKRAKRTTQGLCGQTISHYRM